MHIFKSGGSIQYVIYKYSEQGLLFGRTFSGSRPSRTELRKRSNTAYFLKNLLSVLSFDSAIFLWEEL